MKPRIVLSYIFCVLILVSVLMFKTKSPSGSDVNWTKIEGAKIEGLLSHRKLCGSVPDLSDGKAIFWFFNEKEALLEVSDNDQEGTSRKIQGPYLIKDGGVSLELTNEYIQSNGRAPVRISFSVYKSKSDPNKYQLRNEGKSDFSGAYSFTDCGIIRD